MLIYRLPLGSIKSSFSEMLTVSIFNLKKKEKDESKETKHPRNRFLSLYHLTH